MIKYPHTVSVNKENYQTYMTVCLFDLILYVPVNNFSLMSGWAFLGSRINVSCSRTQHSDAHEARTRSPSISSTLPLSHCAPIYTWLNSIHMTVDFLWVWLSFVTETLLIIGHVCEIFSGSKQAFIMIWASSRQNLSSGFPTKRNSNQSAQLQGLARKLKFYL